MLINPGSLTTNMTETLVNELLASKINDSRLYASQMPATTKLLHRGFASTLGSAAGRMLHVYEGILSQLQAGEGRDQVLKTAKHAVDEASKVAYKLPFLAEKQARLCGLVALNHSGYVANEVALYANLMQDLRGGEEIEAQLQELGESAKYVDLLAHKQAAIKKFSVLMGIEREGFAEATADIPKLAKYYGKVRVSHGHNTLGVAWPLPFKAFAKTMERGLENDSVSYALQKGSEQDFGFENPADYRTQLGRIMDEAKIFSETLAQAKGPVNKWNLSRTMPASLAFLASVDAHASTYERSTGDGLLTPDEIMAAATTAFSSATFTADKDDPGEFSTTFFTCLATLINGA